jgi:hypothetical protein
MKLNHLILVICTGILVGFSACKKDPFTEADAIAAQKELITMKYGYELQLKNIEAAIQKAHDDAQIAITNLNIKGTSDLEKQKAQQEIASYIARLEADRKDYIRQRFLQDSIDRAFAARNAAELAAAAYYNMGFDLNGNYIAIDARTEKTVANAKLKILKWDASGYYEATSNAEGIFVVKQWHIMPNSFFRVEGPANTANAVYANYTILASFFDEFMDEFGEIGAIPLISYDPTNTATLKGTIYAAKDLTNDAADKAGSGIFVKAVNYWGGNIPSIRDTAVIITISGVTNAGAYSLKVPRDLSSEFDQQWDIDVASDMDGTIEVYQRAYTLGEGANPYQVLPTIEDSGLVTLSAGDQDWTAGSAYFMTLPDEDSDKGYSMTLTDPLYILPYALSSLAGQNGVRSPDGLVTFDSSLTSFAFNVDGFVLNNGWMQTSPSEDDSYYYELPENGFNSDSSYKDPSNLNPDSTLYDPLGVSNKFFSLDEWLALSLAERTAIIAGRVANGNTTYTPTTDDTPLYGNDTLAVGIVDLSGFMEDAPELVAIVGNADNESNEGKLGYIVLLEDASGGLFNIDAVLDDEELNTKLFTNYDANYKGAETESSITLYVDGNTTMNFYFGVYEDGFEIRGQEANPYDPADVDTEGTSGTVEVSSYPGYWELGD